MERSFSKKPAQFDISSGEFVAIMDADDISLPDRFEKQINYFDKNPEIDVLGSSAILIDNSREK